MIVRPARPTDAHGIARVHVDSWRTTYPGIVPDMVLARLSYGNRERFWHNALNEPGSQNVVFVAEDEAGKIAGFASGGPEREGVEGYAGELHAIYLYADVQGQGIGRELAVDVAGALADGGLDSMLTWVLVDNPACGFYEALGGCYITDKDITIGEATLKEVAYGWPDISALLKGEENIMETVRKVDQNGLKTGQALTIILLLVAFILNLWPLVALVAIAQLLGGLAAPFAPYKLIYRHIIIPTRLVKPRPETDNPEPHRFAMLVGALFNGVGTLALLAGVPALGGLVWIVIVLANLNYWVEFCLGCWFYYQFNRLGIPGFTQAPIS